jgi:hypothetical protein
MVRRLAKLNRVLLVALCGGCLAFVGCNDEKKPPLTPDGPEMTVPDAGDLGATPSPPAK